ncbi:MAG: methyltransferase domain-containing protein [Nitrososphaera sp.]|jgi:hypothetical protein
MKIEEYLASLPDSIISGEEVELREDTLRDIFRFAGLTRDDIFYHLGCGRGKSVMIALDEFKVKKAVGIDNNQDKIIKARQMSDEKHLTNSEFICQDILNSDLSNASVILYWFSDEKINEKMLSKFANLREGCKVITIWGPLLGCIPDKVSFPYILNIFPFKKAKDLKEQTLAIFETDCIDFVVAWEFAERYTKAIGSKDSNSDRFLTILQTLVIWINAKNLGIACGNDIPDPVKSYMGILKTFFNIEVEHLLDKKIL